jgi:hypothetical protein
VKRSAKAGFPACLRKGPLRDAKQTRTPAIQWLEMKISDRFTDYGLIGGFFWLLQCSVWGFFSFARVGREDLLQRLITVLTRVPAAYVPSLVALLGALAIIAIFTTGLLLDLLGSSYFRNIEVRVFITHLRRNKRWLERVVDQHKDYIQEDWSQLLDAPRLWSKATLSVGFKGTLFWWNPRYRREYVSSVREGWGLLKPYTRVQAFLLSYVLLTSDAEKIELLSTQISLWNTSRAIATAMVLVAVQPTILLLRSAGSSSYYNFPFVAYAAQICLTGVAFAVVYSAHARVCSTLFALAYIVTSKTSVEIAKAAI